MKTSAEDRYRQALQRLISNRPNRLARSSFTINNDTVAIEAGKKRGAIKVARFKDLTDDIEEAEKKRLKKHGGEPQAQAKAKTKQAKDEKQELEDKYQKALNREVNLILKIQTLTDQINELKSNVVQLRP